MKIQKKFGGSGSGLGVRVDVKTKLGGGGEGGSMGGSWLGGQDGCERRIEVFVKIKKKYFFFFGVGLGGQGGCERRIEVFVKIQKKNFFLGGGSVGLSGLGWGVRVDVNKELKFL